MIQEYWTIPEPVRLDKQPYKTSNYDALMFGLKLSTIITLLLLLFLFVGLLL